MTAAALASRRSKEHRPSWHVLDPVGRASKRGDESGQVGFASKGLHRKVRFTRRALMFTRTPRPCAVCCVATAARLGEPPSARQGG